MRIRSRRSTLFTLVRVRGLEDSMLEFCTISDRTYLPQVLVLHDSLRAACPEFRLHVLCMDAETERALERRGAATIAPIGLAGFERRHPELAAVKPTRTLAEYCFTAKPLLVEHLLAGVPEGRIVAYADGDLAFFSSPEPLFDSELGDGAVLVIPHRYAPEWRRQEATHGVYNAGFVAFRRDERALEVLRWWRERCLEWCYQRVEGDRSSGDQKYLDEWPRRFRGVRVAQGPGAGLAPWNVAGSRLERRGACVYVDGRPLVFFHYHSFRLVRGIGYLRRLGFLANRYGWTRARRDVFWRVWLQPPERELELIWHPYARRVGAAVAELRRAGVDVASSYERLGPYTAVWEARRDPPPDARAVASALATALRRPRAA